MKGIRNRDGVAMVQDGEERAVQLTAEDGILEGRFCERAADKAVVLAHPHPRMGGDMDNPVVLATARAFGGQGFSTLRFNFRGVGASQGHFAEGQGERQDLIAAVAHLRNQLYGEIWVAGYSFGAWVCTLALGALTGLRGAVLIAPPIALAAIAGEALSGLPCLVVCGDRDSFCSVEQVRRLLPPATASLTVVPGADHFFSGREQALHSAIIRFLGSHAGKHPAAAPGG